MSPLKNPQTAPTVHNHFVWVGFTGIKYLLTC